MFFVLIFTVFAGLSCKNQQDNNKPKKQESPLVMIFAGDVMNHMPQAAAAYVSDSNKYDYKPTYQYIKPIIEAADFAVCNLETPLAGKPYTGYPSFSGPDEILDALKWSGFNVILLANNHIMDKSKFGSDTTISKIEGRGLKYVGTYRNRTERDSIYPLILKKNGVKIALLNYTYGLNASLRGSTIVNILDTNYVRHDIYRAKLTHPDVIIAAVHWGTEYQLESDDYQKRWATFFAKNGVNMIIGGHPHVVQNFEFLQYKNKPVPVFYSLGNLISNQRWSNSNGGIMARIEIDTEQKTIKNITYIPFFVYIGSLNNSYQYYILPVNDYLRNPDKYPISQQDMVDLMIYRQNTAKTLDNLPTFCTLP